MPAHDDVVVAKATFFYEQDGISELVPKGATVRLGHPMLDGREEKFGPVIVDFDFDLDDEPAGRHVDPGAPVKRGPGRPRKTPVEPVGG